MLMAVDVGNTQMVFGVFQGEELRARFQLMTKTKRTEDELGILLLNLLEQAEISPEQIADIIVSSVVPQLQILLTQCFERYFQLAPLMVGPGVRTGIDIRADNPHEVGADRIVNVACAYELYRTPCIVVDFGTATTFDYVNEAGEFHYTVIMPGLEIVANSLQENTAKLPSVELTKPESILAANTVHGMQAGIIYGYIGAVEHTIKTMKKELGVEPFVLATGGLGSLLSPELPSVDVYDPDVAMKGLKIIYKKTKRITGDLDD